MVGNANDKNYTPQSLMLIKPEYIYLIIIPIFIIIYCIIHSVIYYYFFVNGAYYKISELYNNLIIPDEIIRNDVLKCLNKNIVIYPSEKIVNKELLLLFQNIAYGKEIDISKGKYYVIDISTNDYKVQQKNFENKMLDINKYFTYSKNIHDANYYTFEFFEGFKKLYDELKNKYTHIHKEFVGKNDITKEHNTEEYFIKIMKLLLTIYIYFIEWNNNDPYILIKLNKLIFGRVANIGIPEISFTLNNDPIRLSFTLNNSPFDP
jgi:hypothetical protein